MNIRLSLVSVLNLDSNPWGTLESPVSANTLLETLTDALRGDLGDYVGARDAVQLYSGLDFQSPTVGLAWVGTICQRPEYASSVNSWRVRYPTDLAQVAAHELGHNFGLGHDGSDNICPEREHVMSPVYMARGEPSTTFSSCSITALENLCRDNHFSCLIDGAGDVAVSAVCGDGRVEGDEECEGEDACCNGSTCMFEAGATCSASDPCCDPTTCNFMQVHHTFRLAARYVAPFSLIRYRRAEWDSVS